MRSFAIVLVCYNRLDGLKRLTAALERVDFDGRDDITLIFSVDNSGSSVVEDYARAYEWPFGEKRVRTFPERQGLRAHVMQCGDFTLAYDVVVVLEDDIYVSDSLYHYAYQAADYYWDEDRVAGISLYSFQKNWLDWLVRFEPQKTDRDVFFLQVAQSWGQVWTREKWEPFRAWYDAHPDFTPSDALPRTLFSWPDSSWLKYHDRYCVETGRYFVYPYGSVSTNFSDAGVHNRTPVADHQVELQLGKRDYRFVPFSESDVKYDAFMEREGLGKYLGVDETALTVNLWGKKPRALFRRYVLTTEALPYRIERSFALVLRPAELNVMLDVPGGEIRLYDTAVAADTPDGDPTQTRYVYSLRTHDYRTMSRVALKMSKRLAADVKRKLFGR